MQFDRAELALLSRRGRVPVAIRSGSRAGSDADLSDRPFGDRGRVWWAVALRARAAQRAYARVAASRMARRPGSDPEPGGRDEWHRR